MVETHSGQFMGTVKLPCVAPVDACKASAPIELSVVDRIKAGRVQSGAAYPKHRVGPMVIGVLFERR